MLDCPWNKSLFSETSTMFIFRTLGEYLSRMFDEHILGITVELTYFFPLVGSTTSISSTLLAVLALSSKLQPKRTWNGLSRDYIVQTGKCDLRAWFSLLSYIVKGPRGRKLQCRILVWNHYDPYLEGDVIGIIVIWIRNHRGFSKSVAFINYNLIKGIGNPITTSHNWLLFSEMVPIYDLHVHRVQTLGREDLHPQLQQTRRAICPSFCMCELVRNWAVAEPCLAVSFCLCRKKAKLTRDILITGS